MFGLFTRRAATPSTADAARALGQAGRDAQRAKVRAMTNAMRADLTAKGHNLPQIDWSAIA